MNNARVLHKTKGLFIEIICKSEGYVKCRLKLIVSHIHRTENLWNVHDFCYYKSFNITLTWLFYCAKCRLHSRGFVSRNFVKFWWEASPEAGLLPPGLVIRRPVEWGRGHEGAPETWLQVTWPQRSGGQRGGAPASVGVSRVAPVPIWWTPWPLLARCQPREVVSAGLPAHCLLQPAGLALQEAALEAGSAGVLDNVKTLI